MSTFGKVRMPDVGGGLRSESILDCDLGIRAVLGSRSFTSPGTFFSDFLQLEYN